MNNGYKKFEFVTALLLNVVTCGIYSLYMWYSMAKDANAEAERYGCKKIMDFLPAFLLGMVTCGIFTLVWMYQYSNQMVEIAQKKGLKVAPSDSPIVLLICTFVPIYSFYVLCDNHNRVIVEA